MNAVTLPKPLAIDDETVTFSRAAWQAHVAQIEDASDVAAVDGHDAWAASVGPGEAARLSYTPAEALRMLANVSVITIWRERAG